MFILRFQTVCHQVMLWHLVTLIIYRLSRHGSAVNRAIPEICTDNTVFVLHNLREFYINTFTECYLV